MIQCSSVLCRSLGTLVVAAVMLAACGAPAPERARTGPHPRIVSLVPAATAVIDQLGAAAHLVGVTRYCKAADVPVVGDMSPPPERVLAREPDLVVVGDYPSQVPIRAKLEALGTTVMALPFVTLADMKAATLELGVALGRKEPARALVAEVDAALARAKARAGAASAGPPKVLFVFEAAGGFVYTTGGGDHTSELLGAVGAVNVAAGGPLTTRLALESVLARQPEVVLHSAPSARFPDDGAALAYWRDVAPELPAVRSGRVKVWPDDTLAQNGPWIAGAIDRLSRYLYPEPP